MESFIGDTVTSTSDIMQDIALRKVGGAIIFSSKMHNNVKGPDQLLRLTTNIKQFSKDET